MADLELPETLTVTLVRRVVGLARRVVVRLPRLPRRELLDDLDDLREVFLDCLVLRVVLLVTVTLPLLHLFAFLSQMRLDAFHTGLRPLHIFTHLLALLFQYMPALHCWVAGRGLRMLEETSPFSQMGYIL